MVSHPSKLDFWRFILAITAPLAWFSIGNVFSLTKKLGFSPLASKTWLALLAVLVLIGLISLVLLISSYTSRPEIFKKIPILSIKFPGYMRWLGFPAVILLLAAYPVIMFHPYYGDLLAGLLWMRLLIFWLIALAGTQILLLVLPTGLWPGKSWPAGLLIIILVQASVYRAALYFPEISYYPFAMGWSETSRFYYPALFNSQAIFGKTLAWPILHPSLHFLLLPPYLADLPLWFHRFWQVALRFLLVGLIAPALIWRLKIASRRMRWVAGLWIFLCLFTLPLYLHLAVPVFIMLWGFSASDNRRTWFWLLVASIWAGLSRLNWYPMPGMLAAALYFLEVPAQKKGWSYLIKPVLWFTAGTAVAYLSMQIYIAYSGISNSADFFTSLSSAKLWYRLLPNASYSLGVLPGIVIFSIPFWLVLFSAWGRGSGSHLSRQARGLLLAELCVLFVGGIVVSMKIGGGADIHNMDAYAVLLLVITTYQLRPFYSTTNESGSETVVEISNAVNLKLPSGRSVLHWSVIALLVLVPAWFSAQGKASFWQYDRAASQATLKALQQTVDKVNSLDGEILFITQRHLISMHMLRGVRLIPEYEREELMEMAMAQNDAYLQTFRADLERHRFAAIVVDPLRFNFVGEKDAMGAENNAWTRYVVKKILCNYQQKEIYSADRIAIYVPQTGSQKCP